MIAKSIERFEPLPVRKHLNLDHPEGAGHDQNTYCYRLKDGVMVFKGVELGPGWQSRPMEWRKLSCYKAKGDSDMPKAREDKEQITALAKELLAQGKTITEISKEINVPYGTISTYLKNEQKEQVINSVDAGKKSPHPVSVPAIDKVADEIFESLQNKLAEPPAEKPINDLPRFKVYIAGKITDNPDYKKQFARVESMMTSRGFAVMSPAVLPPGFLHQEYMKICFSMIDICEGVYFLDNWKDSIGAKMEYEYACQNGKILMGRNAI